MGLLDNLFDAIDPDNIEHQLNDMLDKTEAAIDKALGSADQQVQRAETAAKRLHIPVEHVEDKATQ